MSHQTNTVSITSFIVSTEYNKFFHLSVFYISSWQTHTPVLKGLLIDSRTSGIAAGDKFGNYGF